MICSLNFQLSVFYLDSHQIYRAKQYEIRSIITHIPKNNNIMNEV